MSIFTRELIQALSDWQRGGNSKQKAERGARLKANALSLPAKFRECRVCYRQIALLKNSLWSLADNLELPESISAWTESLEVARKFKNGVPPPAYLGVIFVLFPSQESIIVNLHRLYQDEAFQKAIRMYEETISSFQEGMGRYGNSQEEVVVEVSKIRLSDIHELGGYSSKRDELVRQLYGPNPSSNDFADFDRKLMATGKMLGPDWIGGKAKDRAITKIGAVMPRLRAIKKLQEVAAR